MHDPGSIDVTQAKLTHVGHLTPSRPQMELDFDQVSTSTGNTSPELVGHGSWGADGINVGLNDIGFGTPGSSCPYFTFQATVVAGFGAHWNFNMHLVLDSKGNLTVLSDPASGSALSPNGTINHTYYSAFGGGVQWGVDLGCDIPIPIPSVSLFGHTFGGGNVV